MYQQSHKKILPFTKLDFPRRHRSSEPGVWGAGGGGGASSFHCSWRRLVRGKGGLVVMGAQVCVPAAQPPAPTAKKRSHTQPPHTCAALHVAWLDQSFGSYPPLQALALIVSVGRVGQWKRRAVLSVTPPPTTQSRGVSAWHCLLPFCRRYIGQLEDSQTARPTHVRGAAACLRGEDSKPLVPNGRPPPSRVHTPPEPPPHHARMRHTMISVWNDPFSALASPHAFSTSAAASFVFPPNACTSADEVATAQAPRLSRAILGQKTKSVSGRGGGGQRPSEFSGGKGGMRSGNDAPN